MHIGDGKQTGMPTFAYEDDLISFFGSFQPVADGRLTFREKCIYAATVPRESGDNSPRSVPVISINILLIKNGASNSPQHYNYKPDSRLFSISEKVQKIGLLFLLFCRLYLKKYNVIIKSHQGRGILKRSG